MACKNTHLDHIVSKLQHRFQKRPSSTPIACVAKSQRMDTSFQNHINHNGPTTVNFRISEENVPEYRLINVPADGDCFFNCLSLSMNGRKSASFLRLAITNYIWENWSQWKDKVSDNHGEFLAQNKVSYRKHMAATRVFATSCELEAACAYLKCNISVWVAKTSNDTKGDFIVSSYLGNPVSADNIHVYMKSAHYQLMVFSSAPILSNEDQDRPSSEDVSAPTKPSIYADVVTLSVHPHASTSTSATMSMPGLHMIDHNYCREVNSPFTTDDHTSNKITDVPISEDVSAPTTTITYADVVTRTVPPRASTSANATTLSVIVNDHADIGHTVPMKIDEDNTDDTADVPANKKDTDCNICSYYMKLNNCDTTSISTNQESLQNNRRENKKNEKSKKKKVPTATLR